MTLPDERLRALKRVRPYLIALATTPMRELRKETLRAQIRGLLKHYPSDYELDRIAEAVPELLEKRK